MKKVLSLVAVAGLVAASTAAFGGSIVQSKHNLSSTGPNTAYTFGSSTQICVYCHAPHNAKLSLPLWNRTNPTASAFTLYSGLNMANVSFKTGFTADSTSLFCMSCHDGNTNMNAVHNAGAVEGNATANADFSRSPLAGKLTNGVMTGAPTLGGTNLSKTHPINFPVRTDDSQSDLNTGGNTAHMGPGQAALPGYTFSVTFPLFKTTDTNAARSTTNRSLECGSCHAVHDSTISPFLRDTLAGSKLCLGCHNK